MARTDFRSSFHCLVTVSILITCSCSTSYSVPTHPTPTRTVRSQAIVRRQATQSRVLAAVEMKLGVSVMKRFVEINLYKLPVELYDGQNTITHENGLRHFTMLYQYLEIINTVETIGLNTTDLTLFRLIIEQLLTDACNWISTFNTTRINCSDPAEFVTVLLSLGMKSVIDQLNYYLRENVDTTLQPLKDQVWVNKTIIGDYEPLRCPFCTELNLKHCCI